jgi:hypothetical protein
VGLSDRDELVLGLLGAPGWPTEVAEALAEDLLGLLADRVTDAVSWRVPVRTDPTVADMGHGVEAIDLARARLLRENWDMAVCISDAPLRIGTRPVVADASATHGVALISLPALGAVQTRHRARDAVIRLVDGLVGESLELGERGPRRRARVSHRIASMAAPIRAVEPPDDDIDLRFVAVGIFPDDQSLIRLAGMLCIEQNDCHEGRQRRRGGLSSPRRRLGACENTRFDARRQTCSISGSIGAPAARRGAR